MTHGHTQILRRGGEPVALKRRRLRIEVVRGPDKKLRRDLELDRIVIGTHQGADVVLTDGAVSRQHCEIVLAREGYLVRDLDSTNGTFVDSVRAIEVLLDGEARLRVGQTELRLKPLDEMVEIPLAPETRFGPLLGKSPAMRRLFEVLGRISPLGSTVLIVGESGTGKELAARAIHEHSPRAAGPFVVVDCGALPATLAESELMGHERGAFTGAVRDRPGAFEAASGGTIFLDEVGELPLETQVKLLGALERRQTQRLGGGEPRKVDVRVIAATNRDLRREVNRGAFREDLYFRLAVVTVEMPPLRQRPEDIPLYVEAFLADLPPEARQYFDAETQARLEKHPWPGNVRELRNAVERGAALGTLELAPSAASATAATPTAGSVDVAIPFKVGKALLVEEYERVYVPKLMEAHAGNITRAAQAAGIDRVYLLRLLDKFGLRGRK
jgi:DNA-binding NtrC family response regulator